MKFLIPSYKRASMAKTPRTLIDLGVPKSDIYLGVQTHEDLGAYSAAFPDIHVTYGEAHNAAGNRNNLLKLATGEQVVLMDDDVTAFHKIVFKTNKGGQFLIKRVRITSANNTEFFRLLDCGFSIIKPGELFGLPVQNNPLHQAGKLRRNDFIQRDVLLTGRFIAGYADCMSFDDSILFSDDYELCARVLASGLHTYELNCWGLSSTPCFKSKGGCEEVYSITDEAKHNALNQNIVSKYPGILRFATSAPDELVVTVSREISRTRRL